MTNKNKKKIEKYIQVIELITMLVILATVFIFVVKNFPSNNVSNENLMWILILMDGTR